MATITKTGNETALQRALSLVILGMAIIQAEALDNDFFERNVRPLLIEHCYDCHSTTSGKSKGGLLLDSREGWETGGDSGPALVPREPGKSLLIKAISYEDPDIEMPPDGKLSEQEIKILEQWVAEGAPDPRTAKSSTQKKLIDIEAGKQFWAFRQPEAIPPPVVQDQRWARNEIDSFILSRLESAGIQPNPRASERELIRRLYFDLIGLPPTVEQLSEALALPSATRMAELTDRLLASEHFGETWGRHWLDLARYSESTGGGRSALLPVAWRYRNYVIDAFNSDKPFDQFVREQIAGDLLPYENDLQRADQLTATAFLVLGPKNLDLQDKELLRMNTVDEQIDTVTRVFMGLTVSCARCHDHKFDPIPATDYYALAGIFRSTRTLKRSNVSTLTHRDLPTTKNHRDSVDQFKKSRSSLESKIKQLKKSKTPNETEKKQLSDLNERLSTLLRSQPVPLPQTLAVADEETTENYHLCIRGNVHQLGEEVPRSFVKVAMEQPNDTPSIPKNESGRRELASWLTEPKHPLTARVIVNRVWNHLYGEGLVSTVDNFGTQGARPSHPALLDHLTIEFVEDGWSIKSLIRRIVLSESYQLSSAFNIESANIDAENKLRWRMPRRRLTAEAVRDAMLAIAGNLSIQEIESLFPQSAQNDTALQKTALDVPALVNPPFRSVYIPVLREEGLNPLLKVFDFANPSFPVGKRDQSILPTQALYLMNSKFVMQQAQDAASRHLQAHPTFSAERLIHQAYVKTIGRPPSKEESSLAQAYVAEPPPHSGERTHEKWAHLFHSLFASVDFRFLR